MRRCSNYISLLFILGMMILLSFSASAIAQEGATLLRLQRSRSSLDIQSSAPHGKGMWGLTYGNPGDVWKYPNSSSCLVVYNDGRYVLERRDEQTVGRPKTRSMEGSLATDDLQQLRAILDEEGFKKLTMPKAPDLPEDTHAIRDMEILDVQVKRTDAEQRFATIKERVMTMSRSVAAGPSNGMDTFLDNGAPYKKTLNPLVKWFEALEKKSKSNLKESKPQYCRPMDIG